MSSTYRLTGRLEAGELAELYEAVQEPAGTQVIVKLFHPKTSDARYAAVLARASSALNPLNVEGLVPTLDLGFAKNRLAVVREFVDGHTLGAALQRLNTKEVVLSNPVALSLVIQLLEAVERAHAEGVIHGAITPGNVLLSRAGAARVWDFGSLQALLEVPELKSAFAGRGRSAYRAPEVGRGEAPSVLSDIYSLGAIAYELLTLREALVPEGGVSTRRAGLPPPSRLDRRIHARLDPILLRALEPSPPRRFRSCAEFAGALRNFLSNHGGLPGPGELGRFVTELYPNEVTANAPGPVPFTERFALTPISGVALARVSAEPLEKSVVARPSFSPGLSEADTMEAPPAFEEYQPEPTPTPGTSLSVHSPLLASTHIIRPGDELEEPTDRSSLPLPQERIEITHFGPRSGGTKTGRRPLPPPEPLPAPEEGDADAEDEPTWVAPPGAAPKPRRETSVTVGGAAAEGGTRVGRNPRLRVVEDFSTPAPPVEPPPVNPATVADTDRIEVKTEGDRIIPESTLSRSKVTEGTVTRARVPPALTPRPQAERSDIALPPPSQPELPAVPGTAQRRLFTEERNLRADAQRRRRMLGIAGAIALVGAVCFAVGMYKFSRWPHFDTDPKVSVANSEVKQYLEQPPQPPAPKPKPPPVVTEDDTAPTNTAWVSVSANLPARISIDGVRLKHNLPLTHFAVKPGNREIVLETLGPPRQRETFKVYLERGEHKKLEQLFQPPPSPRR